MTDEAIGHLLARLELAWNEGDAPAVARLFAADAAYVTRAGALLRGRPAIEDAFAKAIEAGLTLAIRPLLITLPLPIMCIVVAELTLNTDPASTNAISTLVATVVDDAWQIVSGQTTDVSAIH